MKFFKALILLSSLSLSLASNLDITDGTLNPGVTVGNGFPNHNEAPLEPVDIPDQAPVPPPDSPFLAPPTAQQIIDASPKDEINDDVPVSETHDAANVSEEETPINTNDATANDSEEEAPVTTNDASIESDGETQGNTPSSGETQGNTPSSGETQGNTPSSDETQGNTPASGETQSTIQVDETPGNPPVSDETPVNPPASDETAGANDSELEEPVEVQDEGSDDYGDAEGTIDQLDGAGVEDSEADDKPPEVTDEVPKPEADKAKAEEEEEDKSNKDRKIAAALGGAAAVASAGIFFYIRKSKRNGLESVRTQISMV